MSKKSIKNYYEHKTSNSAPQRLVILLHGLGSNGQDLISLAPYWAQDRADTLFVSPDAPFICDMVPPNYPNAFQWFSLQDRDPDTVLAGIKIAAPILQDFIEAQCKTHDIEPKHCALVGFSQGTMMSLYQAPRQPECLAGVLGYSGALFWDNSTPADALHRLPVHLIHGQADDIVPVEAWREGKSVLEAHGFPFSGHVTAGLAHSIDEKGIASGGAFLSTILS